MAGVMIRIVRGRANSSFRVAWVGAQGTNGACQIGVEASEKVGNF
jgi:hypothetical protein